MSAAALAAAVGTTQPPIQRLETGEIRLKVSMMQRIAEALGVNPADLLPTALIAELQPDLEPWDLADAAAQRLLVARNLRRYRVLSGALSGLGLVPGVARFFNSSPERIADLRSGDVVAVMASERGSSERPVLILRQWIAPGLLTTNRAGRNAAFSLPDEDIEATIVAVLEPDA